MLVLLIDVADTVPVPAGAPILVTRKEGSVDKISVEITLDGTKNVDFAAGAMRICTLDRGEGENEDGHTLAVSP